MALVSFAGANDTSHETSSPRLTYAGSGLTISRLPAVAERRTTMESLLSKGEADSGGIGAPDQKSRPRHYMPERTHPVTRFPPRRVVADTLICPIADRKVRSSRAPGRLPIFVLNAALSESRLSARSRWRLGPAR